jgi:polysaccharide pyruvyl transferase WcaK-like protein
MMAEFIDNIVERFNVAVVLIPHVFGTETRDDRKACKDVFEMVKNKERVVMIQNEYSPEELRSLIGMCQLFIGMRMHAIISALSMHVPTIGIDYSGKVLGIMTMVDQDKLVCHAKTLNLNELWKKFEFVYQYRDEIRTTLKLRVKVLRKRSTMNIILLQKLLVSTHSRLAANFEEYCAKPYD